MTFNQISYRIFKNNYRRYLLYFICSCYTIMVFFIFSTIYTNKKFMTSFQTGSIASNIIAPSIGIGIFSIFFILYAHASFIKFRRSEFGLFMVLGMTNYDIIKIMLFENSLIAIVSISAGLLTGTIISPAFYLLVFKLNHIEEISLSLTLDSYIYTILFFLAVYMLVILWSIIVSLRYYIVNLIKHSRVNDKNFLSKPVSGIIGILIIAISFFDILHNFNGQNSIVILRSFCISFVGIYLCLSSMISIMSIVVKSSKKLKYRNMLFIANLGYTFGQTKKIIFVITLLVSMTIFFTSISVLLMSQVDGLAKAYNPFDIAYVQIAGKNNISDNTLNSILNSSETPLTSRKTLEYIEEPNAILFSDKNLNSTLGYNYKVQNGYFIMLFQVVPNDGYVHKTQIIQSMGITTSDGNQMFKYQGKINKVIINNLMKINNNLMEINNQYIAIINNDDYLSIKAKSKPDTIGVINLMNFKNWRSTKKIDDILNTALVEYNQKNTQTIYGSSEFDNIMFATASKIKYYTTSIKSASFLLILCTFVGILFFVSSAIMLHFKMLTEFETEKIKYRKLNKIGITKDEVSKTIARELKVLFFVPIILSTLLAAFYIYCFPVVKGEGMMSAFYALIIGLIYFGFQFFYYMFYKNKYIKKLIAIL